MKTFLLLAVIFGSLLGNAWAETQAEVSQKIQDGTLTSSEANAILQGVTNQALDGLNRDTAAATAVVEQKKAAAQQIAAEQVKVAEGPVSARTDFDNPAYRIIGSFSVNGISVFVRDDTRFEGIISFQELKNGDQAVVEYYPFAGVNMVKSVTLKP
ncbi:MAG: hypothetical protein HQL20_10880 [Candidatus Omnitrophica bacterium]|nr:hypothetical protein [Candidatus Omnitrophota bacterium]